MNVALVDYGAGNLHSAAKALTRALDTAGLAGRVEVTQDAATVRLADRVVLPGDGAFRDCMANLDAAPGMIEALDETVRRRGRPFLGICVGMQLLARTGTEHGETPGLGWLDGSVRRIAPADPALKVPHMGWNTLDDHRPHALLDGASLGSGGHHAYFLHAYHFAAADPADVIAAVDYGGPVTAVVARDTIAGMQFHPEKSQALGLALLVNFLRWKP